MFMTRRKYTIKYSISTTATLTYIGGPFLCTCKYKQQRNTLKFGKAASHTHRTHRINNIWSHNAYFAIEKNKYTTATINIIHAGTYQQHIWIMKRHWRTAALIKTALHIKIKSVKIEREAWKMRRKCHSTGTATTYFRNFYNQYSTESE